ncbi:MAG: prenyltransferase/squalene oxidase repeat-containing protein [Promethearchaeota archaeon]
MNKKRHKILIFWSIFLFIGLSTTIIGGISRSSKPLYYETKNNNELTENPLISNPQSNYEIITDTFANKLNQYSSFGYFPQIYQSSLQATYYALYILEALDELDQINQTKITDYIISHYDESLQIFMDEYSYRYLDTDFSQCYYPFTSVLEVNCYAILSLNILGQLDLINSQDSIDFIWSCCNPESSENGFIGQPYDSNLVNKFKIATMDNTYYALRTLDLFLNDWSGYDNEMTRITQYINGLQMVNGGFNNDNNSTFDSLTSLIFEPNLLSSYYCIKSLEILNLINTIKITDFYQYLDNLYDDSLHTFQICSFGMPDFCNIIATALGLELSNITGYSSINSAGIINFLLSNRNNLGNWDSSTVFQNHELIDTFQIIRSLKESGEIYHLTTQDKSQIANSMGYFKQNYGYSLISNDYMSIDLIYTIVQSFDLFNSIPDLDIQGLYNAIEDAFQYFSFIDCYGFSGSTNFKNFIGFRSYPIEFYNLGYRRYTHEIDGLYNHKFNYKALSSLQSIFKLDDLNSYYDLTILINNILDSQFLNSEFENFGAFLPFLTDTLKLPESQNKSIFLESSYYAIKTLELLVDFLDLGNIANLTFNKGALYGFVNRNLHETNSMIYFKTPYASNTEEILKCTYYSIYIIKALNLFDLDKVKLKDYVLFNTDYSNVENIYYSFKISEILDFEIDFNATLTNSLIKQIYFENENEFYESFKRLEIDQEIFLWICDMARNSELYIECDYIPSISLGSVNTITAYFSNLIFKEYGQLTTVTFVSTEFGTLSLEEQFDNSYQINFLVPEDPKYLPSIEGTLNIYDHSELIGQVPIFFETTFEQIIDYKVTENDKEITFNVNVSRKINSEFHPIHNSTVVVHVFKDGLSGEAINFTKTDLTTYSKFSCNYKCEGSGNYFFNITLVDKFYPNGLFLFEYEIKPDLYIPSQPIPPPEPIIPPLFGLFDLNGIILAILASIITAITVGGVIWCGNLIKKKIHGETGDVFEKVIEKNQGSDMKQKYPVLFEDWD